MVSRYCKRYKKRNSSVFIAAVMQCSFFSALQFHSHNRLPGLQDGRYWAEKLDIQFLHRSTINMPYFEALTATGMRGKREDVMGWEHGLCRGMCDTG